MKAKESITMQSQPTVLAANRDGSIVVSDTMIHFLTSCCRASATGTTGGTGCRGCYNLIDSMYGMATTLDSGTLEMDVRDMVLWLFVYETAEKVDEVASLVLSKIASMRRHPSRAARAIRV